MRIEAIAVGLPSRRVTKGDILRMLEKHSNGISKVVLKAYRRAVRGLFKLAGSDVRYFRDTAENERPSTSSRGPCRTRWTGLR